MSAFPSTHLITNFFALITAHTPYVALFTSNPGPTGSGSEVAGGSYARQSVTFGAISSGEIQNNIPLTFNSMPASVATHWAIYDAATSGNIQAYGPLVTPITSEAGDNAVINENDITLIFAGS